MSESSSPVKAPAVNMAVICTIFFFSGFPALIYQLVWQRSLFSIYGINVESVTVVVTAFMLGLGLGSLAGGVISKFKRLPLLTAFGIIELGIGAYGYFSLEIFDVVGRATLGASTLSTGIFTFMLVLLPTLLMGATLPILVAYLVNRTGNVGRAVGLLYFVNTLGSAVACFAVALFVMRAFGMQGAVTFAAVMNLLVATGAFAAGARIKPPAKATAETAAVVPVPRRRYLLSALLVGLTGFIALSYEIVWFRVHSYTTGSSALAFSAMLGSFLLGIALGSLFARRFCDAADGARGLRVLAAFVLAANFASFMVAPASSWMATVLPYPFMLPLVVIAAALLGATFPLICHFGVAPDARAGSGMSFLYLSNIIGSSAGSLLTGFVLMHYLGVREITVLLAVFGFVLSAALAFLGDAPRAARIRHWVITAGAAVLVLAIAGPSFNNFYERLQFKDEAAQEGPFKRILENRHGVVTVTQDLRIYGGGMYDGVFNTSFVEDRNMIARPYAIPAFHEAPREVLMIGLASGSWAQVVAHLPGVERLTVIEINPGYLTVIGEEPEVAGVLTNPKVELVIDDGRRWLNRNPDRKFDVVVMNTTWHWRAHASALLSVEFLELVRAHLNPGGMVLYNTTGSDRAQRTACMVFPHVVRIINNVLVSDSPLTPDKDRLRTALLGMKLEGRPILDLSIAEHRDALDRMMQLVDSLERNEPEFYRMEGRDAILRRTEGLPLITDDNMGTEWTLIHKND